MQAPRRDRTGGAVTAGMPWMRREDDRPSDIPPPDRFYTGIIKKLFPGAGMGVVRSATGREISVRRGARHSHRPDSALRRPARRDDGRLRRRLDVEGPARHRAARRPVEPRSQRQAGAEEDEAPEHLADQHGEHGDVEEARRRHRLRDVERAADHPPEHRRRRAGSRPAARPAARDVRRSRACTPARAAGAPATDRRQQRHGHEHAPAPQGRAR